MASKLYALRNVPEDEIEAMRIVLRENNIEFHETDAGFFGIGTAAIWVNNHAQLEQAQALIQTFQADRFENARTSYVQQRALGEQVKFIDLFKQNPVKITIYLVIACLLILLSTAPFWV